MCGKKLNERLTSKKDNVDDGGKVARGNLGNGGGEGEQGGELCCTVDFPRFSSELLFIIFEFLNSVESLVTASRSVRTGRPAAAGYDSADSQVSSKSVALETSRK